MCPASRNPRPSIIGISFDGLSISGIVNEFLNVAAVLRGDKFRVLCDLGFDITIGRTSDHGHDSLPEWVEPIRCIGNLHPNGYTADIVDGAFAHVSAGKSILDLPAYDELCGQLAGLIVDTFVRENVRFLVVENGTIPDNPLFTEALYRAITEYGASQSLGKWVLWRDHDMMWSAEPHLYGSYPYSGVRKPQPGKHILYVVTTEWMRKRMMAWAPGVTFHTVSFRFPVPGPVRGERSLRSAYGIPERDLLIARCTRVVPQKSIDRDLHLLHDIQLRLLEANDPRKVFLFVTGPTRENAHEFKRLRALEQQLELTGQVIWADGLLPFNPAITARSVQSDRFSVRELLSEADLSSFLTTYDYEGFGLPPGEAMAAGVPFIATTYELYEEVYGSKGAVAPLLPIDRGSSPAQIPNFFVNLTLRVLTDAEYRAEIIKRNREVVHRFFSMDALARQLSELLGPDWE
jgi:glycosyltransferase involved in cell wall biosynthesis